MKIFGLNISSPKDKVKKSEKAYIAPQQLDRIRQDAGTRREAIREAEQDFLPYRVKLQRLYLNTKENGHIKACIDRRKDLTLLRNWEFVNPNGTVNEQVMSIFTENIGGKTSNKYWFSQLCSFILDAQFYGYSLVHLGDIINNDFPKINIVRRWHVSPDRKELSVYPYMPVGTKFDEDPYRNWYIYAPTLNDDGVSKCGYGLFYTLSIYEIFLRNLMGFNGDFIELFAQPFRVGKTTKTDEVERAEFANVLQNMGTSGWAMLDDIGDDIKFLESQLGGTGFQGYDNFEQRLEAGVSKLILGHADAIKSIPGKLGNDGEGSPAEQAMRDKQSNDGTYLQQIINTELIPKLRGLGFNIPFGVVGRLKNDNEQTDIANNITDLAVKIKQAGLQMEGQYFTKQTGIPLEQVPMDRPTLPQRITNKLNQLYK
jgi:phage gp29-like protein